MLSSQSLRGGQGPVLRVGPVVEEMYHAGGKCQNEPMGAKHHKMPCEYDGDAAWLVYAYFETLKPVEYSVVTGLHGRSPLHITRVHRGSDALKASACFVFFPRARSLAPATSPKTIQTKICAPKEGTLGLNDLTLSERHVRRGCDPGPQPQSFAF